MAVCGDTGWSVTWTVQPVLPPPSGSTTWNLDGTGTRYSSTTAIPASNDYAFTETTASRNFRVVWFDGDTPVEQDGRPVSAQRPADCHPPAPDPNPVVRTEVEVLCNGNHVTTDYATDFTLDTATNSWVAGTEHQVGEPHVRQATAEELNNEGCPAPESPEAATVYGAWTDVGTAACGETTIPQTRGAAVHGYRYIEASRTWEATPVVESTEQRTRDLAADEITECAPPAGVSPTNHAKAAGATSGELPATGSDATTNLAVIAGLLTMAGAAALLLSRRRTGAAGRYPETMRRTATWSASTLRAWEGPRSAIETGRRCIDSARISRSASPMTAGPPNNAVGCSHTSTPNADAMVVSLSSTPHQNKVSMTEPELSAWLVSIAEVFDDLGVEWALVGALAANRYRATPRFTTDVDTMAQHDDRLVEMLESQGYDVEVIADIGDPPHLLRCHRGPEAVDVLLPVIDYQRVALGRAVDRVLAVEDVIIHKLIAWRPRDRDDVRSILEAGVELDQDYLAGWLEAWDLTERWATFEYH